MTSIVLTVVVWLVAVTQATWAFKVLYAVNAGGDAHIGSDGISYIADPQKLGVASDFGRNLMMIGRVTNQADEYLYQTERYHTATFGYDLPGREGDGEYVLILKFCEVYFNQPNQKVFDVVLNGEHTVVSDLDIFAQVGKGVAHDEYVYFTISRGRLYYKEEESEIRGDRIRIEFIKGYRDNPKVNAIVMLKGAGTNHPRLPPLLVDAVDVNVEHPPRQHQRKQQQEQQDLYESEDDVMDFVDMPAATQTKHNIDTDGGGGGGQQKAHASTRKTSGPKVDDPYALDDSSVMLPVFIAIAAFIPLLFCTCKL